MKEHRKITIKDVALHAGVGIGTVSRAINGSSGLSQKTKKRILESIEELGYVPDKIAQSMRSQKYKNIAFFMDISNVAFAQIAKGIQQQLDQLGYTLSLCDIGDHHAQEKVESFLEGRRFDGIILSLPREDDEQLKKLLTSVKVPIVTLDRDVSWLPPGVVTDYYSSVKKATHHLLSLGHTGIAIVGGSRKIRPTRNSIEGYQDAFQERGMVHSSDFIFTGELTNEYGRRIMYDLIPKIYSGEISSILSLNNQIFHGILQVMRENNLEYPRDLSIITVEDYELTQLLKPAITVIRRPLLEMGRSVSQIVTKYIEKPELYGKLPSIVVSTEFIIRDSCKVV